MKLICKVVLRKERFAIKPISLNALRRKFVSFKTTRRLGNLRDKNQEFSNEKVCKEALKFKFKISVLSE